MSDLGWFSFRPRSRTPLAPKSPPPPDGTDNQETDDPRRPKPNRVSSYINLGSRFSFFPEPLTPTTRASIIANDDDKVWYNPSIEQMVEALQVIMMTKGALEPIPIKYNPYILHLIEAFDHMQEKIEAANAARDQAQDSCSHITQDFKTVADEWAEREAQYKAEVKRLEVILARTSRDGLETVTLARTNSVVDRRGPDPRQFVTRLQELRSQDARLNLVSNLDGAGEYNAFLGQVSSTDTSIMKTLGFIEDINQATQIKRPSITRLPSILDREKDFATSQKLRGEDTPAYGRVQNQPKLHAKCSPGIDNVTAKEPPSQETVRQRNARAQASHYENLDFNSTSSSSDSDEHQVVPFSHVVDPSSSWFEHGLIRPVYTDASLCHQPMNFGNHQEKYTSTLSSLGCNVTAGTRFSFLPGDDISFPFESRQIKIHTRPTGEDRTLDPNEEAWLRSNEQLSVDVQFDRTSNRDKAAAAVAGQDTPSMAGMDYGARPGAKPSLRSNNSTGSMDTVVNLATMGNRDLRKLNSTSSRTTVIRGKHQASQ